MNPQLRKKHLRKLYRLQSGKCFYCRQKCPPAGQKAGYIFAASLDHIVPRSKGGTNAYNNFIMACRWCNSARGNAGVFTFLFNIQTGFKVHKRNLDLHSKYIFYVKLKREIFLMYKQPNIIPVKESGDVYELAEDYVIDLRPWFLSDLDILIEKGFRYDGASIPRWLWSIVGMGIDGLHRGAVLVHDFIYIHKGNFVDDDTNAPITLSRKDADLILRKMLEDVAIAKHRIFLVYWGVRLFGGSVWKN